jgi:hypothetical protein
MSIQSISAQSLQTIEISTGNVATVNDAYVSSSFAANGLTNGALNPIGSCAYFTDNSGRRYKYRYVRLNCTTPPTFIVGPVFWKDNTFSIVTAVESEALFGVNSVAGFLLNVNATNGNYVFIQTFGYLAAVAVPAGTAAGDQIIGAAGNQQVAKVSANTAPTNALLAYAETAVSGGTSNLHVCIEQ